MSLPTRVGPIFPVPSAPWQTIQFVVQSFFPSATASALPRHSLTSVALKFFTAGVSTSPVCSGNVMGEMSRGLLKSDRSPAVAGNRPSVPPTTVNANSDTRGAEKKFSCIDRNPDLQRDLKHGSENGTINFFKFKI